MRICVTQEVWDHAAARIRSVVPDLEAVRLANDDGALSGPLDGVETFFYSEDLYWSPQPAIDAARAVATSGLPWVHSSSAGIDNVLFQDVLDSGAVLSHSPGQHSDPIAEYVLGYLLHHAKRMREHGRAQDRAEWAKFNTTDLGGRTLGIVGYGGIGAAVARRAKAFDMRVVATKRTLVDDANLDELLPPAALQALLAQADYVVLCVPLTDETSGLIGARQLQAMAPHAVLVNVSRGAVVDQEALIDALREGRIGGAVIDVTTPEPLPADSPLWAMENVVITPHDSGDSPGAFGHTVDHWLKNLARYVRGEDLLNVVTTTGLTRRD